MKNKYIGKEIYFNAGFLGLNGMLGGEIIGTNTNYIKIKGIYSYPIFVSKKVLVHKDTKITKRKKK